MRSRSASGRALETGDGKPRCAGDDDDGAEESGRGRHGRWRASERGWGGVVFTGVYAPKKVDPPPITPDHITPASPSLFSPSPSPSPSSSSPSFPLLKNIQDGRQSRLHPPRTRPHTRTRRALARRTPNSFPRVCDRVRAAFRQSSFPLASSLPLTPRFLPR